MTRVAGRRRRDRSFEKFIAAIVVAILCSWLFGYVVFKFVEYTLMETL